MHRPPDEPAADAQGISPDAFDILVVDDDAANLLAIEAALGDLGPRLVKARSGAEALKRLLEQDFALILLDVHMPGMDGFETARLIRSRKRNRYVPIIFVTAYGQSDTRVLEGYVLGAVDFLFKPIVPEVLRAKATVFVQLQQRTAEVAWQAEQLRRHEREQARSRFDQERRAWEQEALRREMAEQHRATDELARRAEELARTVAEREAAQRELTRMNAQLAEADRRKDEFLATLAHELRNPLAPLAYAVGLLDSTDDPVLSEARVRMERQLAHLSRLVDDLLDVSRVTSGKVELRSHPMDAREAIHHAIEVSRSLIHERHHRLELDLEDPLPVHGDAVRLSQIVANLLNNAARYTPSGGRIVVRGRRDEGEIVIEVADDGEGIERDLLDHFFGAFVQAHAGGGGLGLGLHLVSHLVRLHGGRVRGASDGPGSGATFEVRLPAIEPAIVPLDESPRSTPPPPLEGEDLAIVVVEDQEDVREMVVLLLTRWGHRVTPARDGSEGVQHIVDARPDVALIDIGLPDFDGYEVARRVRSELGDGCPLLVAVTGWGQEDDRRRAMEVGFSQHLVKPVSPRALRRVLVGAARSSIEEHPKRGVKGSEDRCRGHKLL